MSPSFDLRKKLGPMPQRMEQAGAPPPVQTAEVEPGAGTAPGFRTAEQIETERCAGCMHWDGEGACTKFGNQAEAMDACDAFEQGEMPMEQPMMEEPVA